jgi:hypothetical protein
VGTVRSCAGSLLLSFSPSLLLSLFLSHYLLLSILSTPHAPCLTMWLLLLLLVVVLLLLVAALLLVALAILWGRVCRMLVLVLKELRFLASRAGAER